MFCEHCGKRLSENQAFCDNCGTPTAQPPIAPTPVRKFHCPHCGSTDLYPITATDTTISSSGGGFSAGKGCLGYFLLGPLGLLCGACGSKTKTTMENSTKNYWACRSCGKKFLDIDNLSALLVQEKENLSSLRVRLFFAIVMAVILTIVFLKELEGAPDIMVPFYSIFIVIWAVLPFVALARLHAGKERCAALEQEKAFLEQHAYGGQNATR